MVCGYRVAHSSALVLLLLALPLGEPIVDLAGMTGFLFQLW
jgi:hypothetical protein